MLLGVDTGGTFTDFVLWDGSELRVHKVLSTPEAPERAILQGMAELGLERAGLSIVHGSTVATNAVLERKGVRTVFITNYGLRDLLTIGRQARRELYNLQPPPQQAPVPASLCLETGGRLGADGQVVEPLTEYELECLAHCLRQLQPEAVAINLLFAFLDDRFERQVEAVVPPGVFVSRSSDVLPEYKEYERGITTWLNAYVGPLVQRYLRRLASEVAPAELSIMQSSAGTTEAEQAGRRAVHLLLSGPAGGLMGARFIGRQAGCERLLTFDMGGTSTDVALIEDDIRLTNEGHIGEFPVLVPMVDMHTIGAGGGSIASLDAGGLLQVGPESAGASPGPACYGRGGQLPTVTDANLILGRLRPEAFLGGGMALDPAAARAAMAPLAEGLGCGLEQAAEGIVRLANEHMAQALRVISVQRGVDPRDFTLMSFGGAGGLHVCALAEALGMRQALVPVHGGVLSALGMLAAPRSRDLSRTLGGLLADYAEARLEGLFEALFQQAAEALAREGVAREQLQRQPSLDLRYQGQSYTLNVPWRGRAATAEAFHATHASRYGHSLQEPIELVNLRLQVRGPLPELSLPALAPRPAAGPRQWLSLPGIAGEVALWARTELAPDAVVHGPALITETVSTTWLAPGWQAQMDAWGNLLLHKTHTP